MLVSSAVQEGGDSPQLKSSSPLLSNILSSQVSLLQLFSSPLLPYLMVKPTLEEVSNNVTQKRFNSVPALRKMNTSVQAPDVTIHKEILN